MEHNYQEAYANPEQRRQTPELMSVFMQSHHLVIMRRRFKKSDKHQFFNASFFMNLNKY